MSAFRGKAEKSLTIFASAVQALLLRAQFLGRNSEHFVR